MVEQLAIRFFIKTYWWWWVAALAIGLVAGLIVARQLKTTYEGTIAVTFERLPDPIVASEAYRYDGYYAEQAALLGRNNFVTWLSSPKSVVDIYNQAGTDLPKKQSAERLRRLLAVSDAVASTLTVTLRAGGEAEAGKLLGALADYTTKNYQPAGYRITFGQPAVVALAPASGLVVGAVTLASALAVFGWSLVAHYLADRK